VNRNFAVTVGGSRSWRQKPMESGDDADETAVWNLVNLFISLERLAEPRPDPHHLVRPGRLRLARHPA
jgi:hypothetical protein